MGCDLCKAVRGEEGLYENDVVKILPTKTAKGHKVRVMVVAKDHDLQHATRYMERILSTEGLRLFEGCYKFVILDTDFATVPLHPHLIATDLEPSSEDWEQLMGTHWLRVVDVRPWEGRPSKARAPGSRQRSR